MTKKISNELKTFKEGLRKFVSDLHKEELRKFDSVLDKKINRIESLHSALKSQSASIKALEKAVLQGKSKLNKSDAKSLMLIDRKDANVIETEIERKVERVRIELEKTKNHLLERMSEIKVSAKEPDIEGLKMESSQLKERVDSIEGVVSDTSAVEDVENKIHRLNDELEKTRNHLLEKVSEVKVSVKEPDIEGLRNENNEIRERVGSIEEKLTKDLRIDDVEKKINKLGSELEKANNHLLEKISVVKVSGAETGNMSKRLESLEERIAVNEESAKGLQSLNDIVDERIDVRAGSLKKMKESMRKMENEFVTREEIDEIENELTKPLQNLDNRVNDIIRRESDRLKNELVLELERLGGMSQQTLQSQISTVLEEIENKRTKALQDELDKLT
jgi:chromosome segregation ATPase